MERVRTSFVEYRVHIRTRVVQWRETALCLAIAVAIALGPWKLELDSSAAGQAAHVRTVIILANLPSLIPLHQDMDSSNGGSIHNHHHQSLAQSRHTHGDSSHSNDLGPQLPSQVGPAATTSTSTTTSTTRKNRPRACDQCHSRRIRCVGNDIPCESCKKSELVCTFEVSEPALPYFPPSPPSLPSLTWPVYSPATDCPHLWVRP